MDWSIAFDPVLPWWAIAVLADSGVALVLALAVARARGVALRALSLAILVAALANPTIRSEEREALTDIAVAVIDRSLSQESAGRTQRTTEAEDALKSAIARLPNTELRTVEVKSGISAEDDGTRAFEALNRALADIPPERFAGAIMITDGQVHDAPQEAAGANPGGPVHGLITGSRAERDR